MHKSIGTSTLTEDLTGDHLDISLNTPGSKLSFELSDFVWLLFLKEKFTASSSAFSSLFEGEMGEIFFSLLMLGDVVNALLFAPPMFHCDLGLWAAVLIKTAKCRFWAGRTIPKTT